MRLRFNLRTVFVLFTLAIVPLATLSYKYHAAQRQQRAIERFGAMGMGVSSRDSKRNPKGDTTFERITAPFQVREVEVRFHGTAFRYAPLSHDTLREQWKNDPSSRKEVVDLLQAMRPIRRLVISQHDVDDHWGRAFGELHELREIEAIESTFSEAAVQSLSRLPKLEFIRIIDCGWSDAEVRVLANCTSLVEVDLDYEEIGDDSVKHLASLPKLEYLGIRGTAVTNAAIGHLSHCGTLRVLDLHGTGITDAGIEHVSRCRNLESLNLGGTGITDAAIGHLTRCRSLVRLYLSGTHITDGALNELAQIGSLTDVDLSGTQVTAEGFVTLSKDLPLLYRLRLHDDVPLKSLAEIRANRPGIKIEEFYSPRPEPSSGNPFEITFVTISGGAAEAGSDDSP